MTSVRIFFVFGKMVRASSECLRLLHLGPNELFEALQSNDPLAHSRLNSTPSSEREQEEGESKPHVILNRIRCPKDYLNEEPDWAMRDSNPRHPACKAGALTTELIARRNDA